MINETIEKMYDCKVIAVVNPNLVIVRKEQSKYKENEKGHLCMYLDIYFSEVGLNNNIPVYYDCFCVKSYVQDLIDNVVTKIF